jgi:hypothetical protein
MSKKLFINIVLFFIFSFSFSQEHSRQWGVLNNADQTLSSFKDDPEAEAVILYDIGETYFDDTYEGFEVLFTRMKRIKILDDAGIDYSEISIPYYVDGNGKTELVKSIKAFTYNYDQNGILEKTELNSKDIFDEKATDKVFLKKFTFPNVKKGSIIEYQYVLRSPFLFNIPDWDFQNKIPTIYSEFIIYVVPFYEYSFITQGISKFDHQNKSQSSQKRAWRSITYNDVIYNFAMKDVPAFRNESYITSVNDYIMKIDFQLAKIHNSDGVEKTIITTWPEMIREFKNYDNFGRYIKSGGSISKSILKSEIIFNNVDSLEMAKDLIDYTKHSFNWNGRYSKYASQSPKQFYKTKSGNSADLNLFLVSLLKTAGIHAQPVLISTRGHGKIKADYPFSHFFNHVIVLVKIGSNYFLADGTAALTPYNMIPPNCLNEKGLIMEGKEAKWVILSNNKLSTNKVIININPDPQTLAAKVKVLNAFTEYEAFYYRDRLGENKKDIKDYFIDHGISKIDSTSSHYYKIKERPFTISADGSIEINQIADEIIIYPFLNFPVKENKLKEKTRNYPLDFIYPLEKSFHTFVTIPEGYRLSSYPESFSMDNGMAEIFIETVVMEESLEVLAKFTLKNAVYKPNDYSSIKAYFDMVIKKFNQAVVLEKIQD